MNHLLKLITSAEVIVGGQEVEEIYVWTSILQKSLLKKNLKTPGKHVFLKKLDNSSFVWQIVFQMKFREACFSVP